METRRRNPHTQYVSTPVDHLKQEFQRATELEYCLCKPDLADTTRKIIRVGDSVMSVRTCDLCGGKVNKE